jgi:hypothetical protein
MFRSDLENASLKWDDPGKRENEGSLTNRLLMLLVVAAALELQLRQ